MIFSVSGIKTEKLIKERIMGRGRKNKTRKMVRRKGQAKKKAKLKAKKSGKKKV